MEYKSEEEFLKNYDSSCFEKLSCTTDIALFSVSNEIDTNYRKLSHKFYSVLLVKRKNYPFKDKWCLPGGFIRIDEDLEDAPKRILKEETNIDDVYLEQLYTFGDIDRDPRYRILSVSYLALCPFSAISNQSLTDNSRWALVEVSGDKLSLKIDDKVINDFIAFDHLKIINYAISRMQNKLYYTDIAFSLLEDNFTLYDLQNVFELILGIKLHKSNFRRDISSKVVKLDTLCNDKKGRPCYYYRRKKDEDFSCC